jgi:hypothetical protein
MGPRENPSSMREACDKETRCPHAFYPCHRSPLKAPAHCNRKGILHHIMTRARGIKASLYADDASIFIKPIKQDVIALKNILDVFGQASGLRTNL